MRIENVCVVTLDDRDVRRATSHFGIAVDHLVRPDRTIIRICTHEQQPIPVIPDQDADEVPWGASIRDTR